ncbi:MAG: NUDIX domain-containing protein, partial [Anaerolineae bacterium]|nr:NUDIX domain-containing protein [Anaerolineae bacterium]
MDKPTRPEGHPIASDPYFMLMADAEGVGYVHCGDGVLVVPLTADGQALLAVEYSPAFGREILTLVAGSVDEGESPEEAANRELQEELGWRAERIDFLAELHPFKYLDSRQLLFLAQGLVPSRRQGDERHPVQARRVPLEGWFDLCLGGELQDALAVAALCLAQRYRAGQ